LICPICKRQNTNHCHHIIPQANGGVNGKTIDLCGTCHTNLHSAARAILAGKSPDKHMGKEHQQRAIQLIAAIVNSTRAMAGQVRPYKISFDITTRDLARLNEVRGTTSIQSYCKKVLLGVIYAERN